MNELESSPPETDQETTGRTVVGMFPSRGPAEAAIRELKASGFGDDRIGVATRDDASPHQPPDTPGGMAAEGAVTGALSGGVVGGLIGLLGSILVPGLGPIVVGGVLASTLAGAGVGAAAGGVIGALMGLGLSEEDARHFDSALRSGGTLVTVSAGSRTAEALAILERHGVDFGPRGGTPVSARPWEGPERRTGRDPDYPGPERRFALA